MALGNASYSSNQGNNQTSMWEPSYYSRLKIKNPSENLALNFSFWKGTLKISIGEAVPSNADNKVSELAYIHLSPTKARILAKGVSEVLEDAESDKTTCAVDTGIGETHGFIAIGRNGGVPFLFIAKVNSSGKYESSQRFNFNHNYNYLLRVHNLDNLQCQKEYLNDLELQQFYDLLIDYATAASGALGASIHDLNRYEAAKISNLIKKVAEKTGAIDRNSYGKSNNSFFSNVDTEYESPSDSTSTTKQRYQNIDDLENEF